jgi:hypothetical protein
LTFGPIVKTNLHVGVLCSDMPFKRVKMHADSGLCFYVALWSCVVCDVIVCHKPCSWEGAHVVFVEWRVRM